MYTNLAMPEYFYDTPLETYGILDNAYLEVVSGEQVKSSLFPKDINRVLSNVTSILLSVKNYHSAIVGCLVAIEGHPDFSQEIRHSLMEQEGGSFVVGINVPFTVKGHEYLYVTTLSVPFDVSRFNSLYTKYEVPFVDDCAIMSVAVTQALSMIVQNTNIREPVCQSVLNTLALGHVQINEKRWDYIERELRHGIPVIHIVRRWGLVDKAGIIEQGEQEYERFHALYQQIKKEQ